MHVCATADEFSSTWLCLTDDGDGRVAAAQAEKWRLGAASFALIRSGCHRMLKMNKTSSLSQKQSLTRFTSADKKKKQNKKKQNQNPPPTIALTSLYVPLRCRGRGLWPTTTSHRGGWGGWQGSIQTVSSDLVRPASTTA